jgi:hypothetical protein
MMPEEGKERKEVSRKTLVRERQAGDAPLVDLFNTE